MNKRIMLCLCAFFLQFCQASGGLVIGRIDDFEDGTMQGWSGGAQHEYVSGGGPAGATDGYLELTRPTPTEPYPFHIGTKNSTTWAGDYLAAGIKAIEMDVNVVSVSFGPDNLSFRIVLFGPGGAFSTREPVPVITGGGWQRIRFGLTRSDLVHLFAAGSGYTDPGLDIDDLTDTLHHVDILLIRHDSAPSPSLPGTHPEHVLASFGIDNITAVLGLAPTYDVAWTFGNITDQSFVLDNFEPHDVVLGNIGAENPELLLHLNNRYQVTVSDPVGHPFEIIAKGSEPVEDYVLLSADPNNAGQLENDPDVAWDDNGTGTVTFTLTERLYRAMTASNRKPGYRCGLHASSMRGDFTVCSDTLMSDLNGDCNVDFLDLALFASQWLESSVAL